MEDKNARKCRFKTNGDNEQDLFEFHTNGLGIRNDSPPFFQNNEERWGLSNEWYSLTIDLRRR